MSKDNRDEMNTGRPRPKTFRALGPHDPPQEVVIAGVTYRHRETFKHDSWAATALYACETGQVVCKFNRCQSIGPIPMRWLGRLLARREKNFLKALSDLPGIPKVYETVTADGRALPNVTAHDFVEGKPLSISSCVSPDFFDRFDLMLQEMHRRRIAYIDLHKQENVIVGDDGAPHLIDFQISFRVPDQRCLDFVLRILTDCDRYHAYKHRAQHGMVKAGEPALCRPKWICLHRKIAVPFRTMRRRLLVALGIRRGYGAPSTESAPEIGLRRAHA